MSTNVYIDGFNLYYGCLRNTPYRWLDLESLCRILLPRDNIQRIKYFTAHVSARPHDPNQPMRQQIYLRALRTLPTVTIITGQFLTKPSYLPLAAPLGTPKSAPPTSPVGNPPQMVWVMKAEEKGSDVNLATHLLVDACRDDFDTAVVITNDSDLLEPIKVVQAEYRKSVGVLNPQHHPSVELKRHAQFFKDIRPPVLAASQFPPLLTDKHGVFHKPAAW